MTGADMFPSSSEMRGSAANKVVGVEEVENRGGGRKRLSRRRVVVLVRAGRASGPGVFASHDGAEDDAGCAPAANVARALHARCWLVPLWCRGAAVPGGVAGNRLCGWWDRGVPAELVAAAGKRHGR